MLPCETSSSYWRVTVQYGRKSLEDTCKERKRRTGTEGACGETGLLAGRHSYPGALRESRPVCRHVLIYPDAVPKRCGVSLLS